MNWKPRVGMKVRCIDAPLRANRRGIRLVIGKIYIISGTFDGRKGVNLYLEGITDGYAPYKHRFVPADPPAPPPVIPETVMLNGVNLNAD